MLMIQNVLHKASYSNFLSYTLHLSSPFILLCSAGSHPHHVHCVPCAQCHGAVQPKAILSPKGEFVGPDTRSPSNGPTLQRQNPDGAWEASFPPVFLNGEGQREQKRGRICTDSLHIKPGCNEGQLSKAVEALDFLVQQRSHVDVSVLYCILEICLARRNLVLGSRVHALAVRIGFGSNNFLANHIIRMYGSHGKLKEAMQVFSAVAEPTCHMWASITFACTRSGQPRKGIEVYWQMRASTVKPNDHVFVAVLKACAVAEDLQSGREVHADMLKALHEPNKYVGSCLVDMYAKCGSLEDARVVFDKLRFKDVVTWNAIITGYAQHGLNREALDLFGNMQNREIIVADKVTYVCLLQSCAGIADLQHGKVLHAQVKERGLEADEVIGSCLVNMYAKCGSFTDACGVFGRLSMKNVMTWTVMIAGYAQHGLGEEALSLYAMMQQEGRCKPNNVTFVSLLQACASIGGLEQGKQIHAEIRQQKLEDDVIVGTCLVDMYAKCNSLEDAGRVFKSLPTKDVVTWNAMIAGYAQQGLGHDALTLFACMEQEGCPTANVATFLSLFQACGSISALEKGKELHAKIGWEVTDLSLANPLIDMYGKCGSMTDAQHVFDGLSTRDTVTWNALISGYARQGKYQLVLNLYDRMQLEGMQPDCVTFLSVLTVCNHVGSVDQGQAYFDAMATKVGITPTIEHYICMIDLLGRSGLVDRAIEMVRVMPYHSHGQLWRTVLGACRKWNLVEIGRQAFDRAMTVDKHDSASYVLMTNIYAAAGMWKEVGEIQQMKVQAKAWKKPGQSWWTGIDGTVHTFLVGDVERSKSCDLFSKLGSLFEKMIEEGYMSGKDLELFVCQ